MLRLPYTIVPLYLLLLVSGRGHLFGQTSFDEWKEEQERQFQTFMSEEDAAFSAFLEEEWEAFQVQLSELIYANPVDAAAATWFTMVASGYDMRVAYNSSQLALLLPSSHTLYGVSFFPGDNRRYYLLNPDGSAVRSGGGWQTYRGKHSNATKSVALTLPPVLNVPELVRNEELEFTYRGEQFTIQVPINQHVVNLLEDYPFTDWYVHFSLPVSRSARRNLPSRITLTSGVTVRNCGMARPMSAPRGSVRAGV